MRGGKAGVDSENRDQLEDRVCRSYGILKFSRIITSDEILHLISQVRLV